MGVSEPERASAGFTLIELSIVLVIIGLVVGGVLAGRDLIKAAEVRAQITQIEKFNTAATTFFQKYGMLPGDITPTLASQFGFTVDANRTGTVGEGDGNGELDGGPYSYNQGGELIFFWQDLSLNTHLIEDTVAVTPSYFGGISCVSNLTCAAYFPKAKIGNGNVVYVYSGYATACASSNHLNCGPNFFGLSIINSTPDGNVSTGAIPPAPGLTVSQASAIDKKLDDGLPTTGNVLAQYLGPTGGYPQWATSAASDSASTCYNSSNAYSVVYANGANITCALSFKMQAGD